MIEKIGVIGAGQMGGGIAHVCAVAGYQVTIQDLDQSRLDQGVEAMETHMARQVSRNKLSVSDKDKALKRIGVTTSLSDLASCDVVIEAATENEDIKKAIFRELSPLMKPHAILATNTSSISITALAAVTKHPERFIGMHFMNPVPVMALVEIIRGLGTSDSTYTAIESMAQRLGKQISVSEDYPGFIVNRILMPMINEAIYALYEGVGTIESIDKGMRLGTNHPMGPLQLADLIGLDTCRSIMNVLFEGLGGAHYKPCPLLVNYVEAGWLGRKVGRGFYDYSGEMPQPTR